MKTKVGINGFGRIGRCIARHILEDRDDLELVKINASGDLKTNTHLLNYDSVHGRFRGDLGDITDWSFSRDIKELSWPGVDVVLECTGSYNDGDYCKAHIENGAKKVIISAPAVNVNKTIVYGVNHEEITSNDEIISNASCTTNCLAPMAKVLHKELGIVRGMMTTIHSYTGDQGTIDRRHRDLYRARAGAMNMIPTSTGAATALKHVLPELEGKIEGSAIRVPTPNVSCVDFTVETKVDIPSSLHANHILNMYAIQSMEGIMKIEDQPLVSADFNHSSESCIVAADQTKVVGKHLLRLLAWYDNEWGFSCRMADLAKYIGEKHVNGN